MYPDEQSNPKSSGKSKTADPTSPPASARPRSQAAYRQIQAAHTKYFEEIALGWNERALRLQGIQTEYQRASERAWPSQDVEALQEAQDEYQRAWQEACNDDPGGLKPAAEAFRNYKAAIVKALADASADDLTFTDLGQLSQSLAIVSQYAMTLAAPAWSSGAAGAMTGK